MIIHCVFEIQMDNTISARQLDLVIVNKKKKKKKGNKKRVPTDQRVKLKDNEKKDKYQDLARGLKKKQWNI